MSKAFKTVYVIEKDFGDAGVKFWTGAPKGALAIGLKAGELYTSDINAAFQKNSNAEMRNLQEGFEIDGVVAPHQIDLP